MTAFLIVLIAVALFKLALDLLDTLYHKADEW